MKTLNIIVAGALALPTHHPEIRHLQAEATVNLYRTEPLTSVPVTISASTDLRLQIT
jgi:hypothetical protein